MYKIISIILIAIFLNGCATFDDKPRVQGERISFVFGYEREHGTLKELDEVAIVMLPLYTSLGSINKSGIQKVFNKKDELQIKRGETYPLSINYVVLLEGPNTLDLRYRDAIRYGS